MQMPKGWRWLNRLSPATWIIYGLAVDQLGENTNMMTAPDGSQQTVSQFMKSYFGYDYSFRWSVPMSPQISCALGRDVADPLYVFCHRSALYKILSCQCHAILGKVATLLWSFGI